MATSNIVVLTTGLSGSSVVTGFIAQKDYWLGDKTIFKSNASGHYETYENEKLVELNNELLATLGVELNESSWYDINLFERIRKSNNEVDTKKFVEFINYCQQHGRWIWKDPRLWITMGFWGELLQCCDIKYIVVSRQPISLWVSLINKRQIVSYSKLKVSERDSHDRIIRYLSDCDFPSITMNYDKLVEQPKTEIHRLNNFLNSNYTLKMFRDLYKGKIGGKTFSKKNFIKAILIYIKNYNFNSWKSR
ncbi:MULTISPECIES: sulfotransferase family protein [Colwellia]|uniref:Sulfotransferase family protein n=1 Tax=Colwellia marinimaniae TaxID=1513592 RepID=A0ABQ0MTJ6_9GAMM|nr:MULTISPECIES: sulfotransferase family protein [Colwellia]GAW95542.1 hypothetical protein MTCD1_01145 [Colwellia marinimaniae]